MNRPWQIAVVFALCLAVVLAALGWTSHQVLRLERAQTQEENIRLALWRMESALVSLVAQEATRPYFEYSPFYSPDRAYSRMYNQSKGGADVLVPSSILVQASPYIRLHFQIGPDGALTSPQAPGGSSPKGADPLLYTTKEDIARAEARLAELRALVSTQALADALPGPQDRPMPTTVLAAGPNPQVLNEPGQTAQVQNPQEVDQRPLSLNNDAQAQRDQQEELPNQAGGQQGFAQAQNRRNVKEYQARAQTFQQMATNTANFENPGANRFAALGDVREGVMKAVWLGGELVLARRVSVGGREYIQGAWLDWAAIRTWLLESVRDLVPQADLAPVRPEPEEQRRYRGRDLASYAAGESSLEERGRLLATLPVRLAPGAAPAEAEEGLSPLRLSLIVAWLCVFVAGAAVAVLLWGTVALSERRAAFVSAVTHELRTPLTTLRMYAEMLAAGMVPDEAKRQRYLGTLRVEADRLGHLVENVLAYARLERGRASGRIETVTIEHLIDRVRQRLAERAQQAGMQLVVEPADGAGAARVRADVSAVEQILFNLVDNACKYAATATDRRIHLVAAGVGGRAALKVCDHGPGIAAADAGRLFRPFSKSARDAANSAPGVGLGLALSRRLAREVGGDLTLEPGASGGACFVLRLIS